MSMRTNLGEFGIHRDGLAISYCLGFIFHQLSFVKFHEPKLYLKDVSL